MYANDREKLRIRYVNILILMATLNAHCSGIRIKNGLRFDELLLLGTPAAPTVMRRA